MADETGRLSAEEKARRAAYEKGKADAASSARVEADARHLKRLNGAIDRIDGCLEELVGGVRRLQERAKIQDAVSEAQTAAIEKQGEAAISTRTFVLGVLGIMGTVAGLYLSSAPS